MDDHLRRKIGELAMQLAMEERPRLEAAGTFVNLELLVAEIGDAVARQMINHELARRASAVAQMPAHPCPTCGKECPLEPDPEPIILQGYRGEVEYQEPRCHCSRCRRDFFPSGAPIGALPP
jgi:hypothetical protein